MNEYDGVVIVTGAAQGIGEQTARDLAALGAQVAVADIQLDKARDVADSITSSGGRASAYYVDVSERESATRLIEDVLTTYARVDALVNNGGIDAQGGGWWIDDDHWDTMVATDLSGQWWCTKAVLPAMIEQKSGRIVFVSSSSVYVGGTDISVAYCAAKAGLIGLTVALSSQLEQHGVLVNCLMPGPTGDTGTPMNSDEVPEYLERHPLGFGGAQPISDAVAYLLLPSGKWTSGSILNVSGGRLRGR
ncbi:SDR family NAD(P)-dependent oxidoreductase [Mycolicibacterium baixiangningiae]|uniref:SDR family NAD(P)-dependent oxidoreductase n=1 Tax=Mycolicibacterium baixiangningiae TaxID=2761578 RepID=UPI0018CFF6FD|nr:SDR family oxidoreductase [Mycolicibacterium baixiangningiae]